jgi:hypothetical protein
MVGLLGVGWGVLNLRSSEAAGAFWDVETHLLRFETYRQAATVRILKSAAAQDLSPCDNHSQRALLLLEIPLADAALRSGSTGDFDQHMRSLEVRTRRILSCSPRDSFVWLIAFGLEIEHGTLSDHTFDLLAMSYETSPNEAWIAARRIVVAAPVVLSAPDALQKKILTEFQELVRPRFFELPALAYLKATSPTRSLLQRQIEGLNPREQKAFSEVLDKLHS